MTVASRPIDRGRGCCPGRGDAPHDGGICTVAKHHHSSDNLRVALLLNMAFTLIELAGSFWTNSVAILSDAVHDSGDTVSLGTAWYLHRVSERAGDRTFSYGYRRFSVLGALITGVVLLAGLAFMLWRAIPRLLDPQQVDAPGMTALAVLGIATNGFAALKLRGGASLNEAIVSWHLLEDVLGWTAVLAGGLVMTFWNVPVLDPLLSVVIALFVSVNVVRQLNRVFRVFLQSAPDSFDLAQFEHAVTAIPAVQSVHHTHPWSIDGEHHVLTTHVVVPAAIPREDVVEVKQRVRDLLDHRVFEHVTVEVEFGEDDCSMRSASRHTSCNGLDAGIGPR